MSQRVSPALLRSIAVLVAIGVMFFVFKDQIFGGADSDTAGSGKSELGEESAQAPATPLPPPRARDTGDAGSSAPAAREMNKERYQELKTRLEAARDKREQAAKERREQDESERPELAAPTLDKEYIQTQVKEIVPLFRECYEMALERDPAIGGTITVEMVLTGEEEIGGILESSEVMEDKSDVKDAELNQCIRESMYAIELDPPEGGGTVTIRYPLKFANADQPPAESETPER